MKTSFLKIMTAALGLSLLAAPLTADAATYGYAHAGPHGAGAGVVFRGGPGPGFHGGFGGPGYRGGFGGPGYHGGFYGHGGYGPGYYGYHYGGFYHPVYRPVAYGYARPVPVFYNGYFGFAPGGWSGYYYNGFWYHHRRWSGGVWIYF